MKDETGLWIDLTDRLHDGAKICQHFVNFLPDLLAVHLRELFFVLLRSRPKQSIVVHGTACFEDEPSDRMPCIRFFLENVRQLGVELGEWDLVELIQEEGDRVCL